MAVSVPLYLDVLTCSSPLAAARVLRAARRRRDVLGAAYTFGGGSLHAPWRPPAGSLPRPDEGWGPRFDPRRVMVLSREEARPVRADAVAERWHLRLRAVRTAGTLDGGDPLDGISAVGGTGPEPGLVVTYALVPPHLAIDFFRYLMASVLEQHAAPGALASFSTIGMRGVSAAGFTVSAWESLDDALRWVRGGPAHAAAMRWLPRHEAPKHGGEAWFCRCVVEGSEGTLAGRDPFAALAPALAA